MDYPGTCSAVLLKIAILLVSLSEITQVHGILVISLEERSDASLIYNTLIEITNVTANQTATLRRIDLVPGRTYHLHCEEKERSGSLLSAVWFSGDSEVSTSDSADMVYSFLDGSRRTLVLSNFTGGNVGIYRCRERGSSNTDGAGVVFGSSNPTVITTGQNKMLTHGQQAGNLRPSLIALLSGTPYPSASNIVWRLNDETLPSDFIVNGNELLLPGNIKSEMEGRYTCHVTTSAGNASGHIYVNLIYSPSVSITPLSPLTVEINSSITLFCEDSKGVPRSTFTWSHNGSSLRESDRMTRTDVTTATSHRSSLIIVNFQSSDFGDYKCTATNEAGISHQTISVNLLQISPPAPPTDILVTFISACSIRIEWVWPQILPNDNMATPDYIVFESNIVGEPRWREVGRADTAQSSLVASVPATGIDTQFQLRAKCVSNSHGDGEYYTLTDVFTAYSSATLPAVVSLTSRVLSSTSIQLSWDIQKQDCFNVTSFTISCKPASDLEDNRTLARSTDMTGRPFTMATVTGLEPDTSYNCSVSGNFTERVNGEFSLQVKAYAPTLATTHPNVGIFELYLKGISNCELWTIESTAAKKDDIAMAIAVAIERLCNCGFAASNIQIGEHWCSSSLPSVVVYQMEVHDTEQASLPQLLSYLREWVSMAPSFVVRSQLVTVDGGCFLSREEDCVTIEESQTEVPFTSTYVTIGVAVGVALLLIVTIVVVLVIAILITRHRKIEMLNSSLKKRENGTTGVTNPAAIPQVHHESVPVDPYYEEVDIAVVEGEPQYESLDDYDKLSPRGFESKITQGKLADCPAYEPTTFRHD